jgi:predicted dehydrogenase
LIKIGVIGLGYWGPNYVRVFSSMSGAKVTLCCDPDRAALDSVLLNYPQLKGASSSEEVIESGEVDAVVISTPASVHYRIAKKCLLKGKPVLIEKPMTTRSSDAEDLCKIAERNHITLMVGHTYLYHAAITKIKNILSTGDLGKVFYTYAIRTGLGPVRYDVNALWDLAPHDISILLYLLDCKPVSVVASGQSYIRPQNEDVVFATLMFPDNVISHIHVSWLNPVKVRRMCLVGNEKMLIFDDTESLETIRIFDKGVDLEPDSTGSYGEFKLRIREGDIYSPRIKLFEPLKSQCLHFIECIEKGKRPLTDGYFGLDVVRILEAADTSLKSKSIPMDTHYE